MEAAKLKAWLKDRPELKARVDNFTMRLKKASPALAGLIRTELELSPGPFLIDSELNDLFRDAKFMWGNDGEVTFSAKGVAALKRWLKEWDGYRVYVDDYTKELTKTDPSLAKVIRKKLGFEPVPAETPRKVIDDEEKPGWPYNSRAAKIWNWLTTPKEDSSPKKPSMADRLADKILGGITREKWE